MKKTDKKIKKQDLIPGIALSFLVSILTCIYAPLDLYFTNINDFWMHPVDMVIPIIVVFFGVFVLLNLLFVVAKLIGKIVYNVFLGIVSGSFIGMYIQGNFLIKNLPSMDGTAPDWGAFPAERIKSIFAFLIPVGIMVFLFVKFRQKEKTLKNATLIGSACISLMLIATVSVLAISTDTSKPDNLTSTHANEFAMSKNKNVIVLILDAVDGDAFQKELKKYPEFQKELDGFTYYEDALAAYPYTSRSLPMIFSGKWFENKGDFREYEIDAFSTSPFINKLEEENYNIGIYEQYDINLAYETFNKRFDNCISTQVKYNTRFTYEMILAMGSVKFAPWDLKLFGWRLDKYQIAAKVSKKNCNPFDWSDLKFYNSIKDENPITLNGKNSARIIHLIGAHVPFQYDEKLEKEITDGSATYESNIDACITLTKQYIERLKESGIYDNSAIVIMADHGYCNTTSYDEQYMKQRVHPIFMVKGFNESHEFRVSSAPISYADLSDAFVLLADGKKSNELFKYSDSDTRTRRYILYAYGNEDYMTEFLTDGKASDTSAMRKTGTEYNAVKK